MENGEKPKPNLRIEHSVGPKQLFINQTLEKLTEEDIISQAVTFTPEDFRLIIDEVKKRSEDKNSTEKEKEKWMALYRALAFS
ncbi:MAG: hypothetical protein QG654_571 [Patescibacteria group bacterium]|jgi:hypothetical protein|nr:hypothetical protein [Patescibacteria group bacterium]